MFSAARMCSRLWAPRQLLHSLPVSFLVPGEEVHEIYYITRPRAPRQLSRSLPASFQAIKCILPVICWNPMRKKAMKTVRKYSYMLRVSIIVVWAIHIYCIIKHINITHQPNIFNSLNQASFYTFIIIQL